MWVRMLKYKLNCVKSCTDSCYGLDVFENETLVRSVREITGSYSDIIEIANMCNELKIELFHFDDIIEDYLTDFCV